MNVYKLLKLSRLRNVPGWVKLLGLWGMYVGRRRCIGIFLDPVLACNLRCRMCLFSTEEHRRRMKGMLDETTLDRIEASLFPHALKLQIGCGAEPTLYGRLRDIVERGRRAGIPYISLVTNGQLIGSGKIDLMELAEAGLDELTLSMHGTRAETYEYLMPGARFDLLKALLDEVARVKGCFPGFKVRVNFTVNSLNIGDLEGSGFWDVWPKGVQPNIVQLRPVQNLGDSSWTDFDLTPLKERYDATFGAIIAECSRRGIICIAPERDQLDTVATPQSATEAAIEDFTYCYVAPGSTYKQDFNLATDTFRSYHRRHHTGRRLLRKALCGGSGRDKNVSKKLNYTIK